MSVQTEAPPKVPWPAPGYIPGDDPVLAAYRAGFEAGRAHACAELATMEDVEQEREWWNVYAFTVASPSFREEALRTPERERSVQQQLAVRRVRLVRLP